MVTRKENFDTATSVHRKKMELVFCRVEYRKEQLDMKIEERKVKEEKKAEEEIEKERRLEALREQVKGFIS